MWLEKCWCSTGPARDLESERKVTSISWAPQIQKGWVGMCLSGRLTPFDWSQHHSVSTLCQGLCYSLGIQSHRIILIPKLNSQLSEEPSSSKMHMSQVGFNKGIRTMHFQVALLVKNPSAIAGDIRDSDMILWSGRSPGEGNSNPLQYSCLENPMDRGAWWASVHRVSESNRTETT